jgi:hypothetical protein
MNWDFGLNQDSVSRKMSFSEYSSSSCHQNWTCQGSFEMSQRKNYFGQGTHDGDLCLQPPPQSGQSPRIPESREKGLEKEHIF